MTERKTNPFGWIEIPVSDMERAMKFYKAVLGYSLDRHQMKELDMAWFPWDDKLSGAAGTLVKHDEWYKPSAEGTLAYFSAQSGDLENELGKVEDAGGKVLQPKKSIGEHGHIAICMDTEGNRFALHSMQ